MVLSMHPNLAPGHPATLPTLEAAAAFVLAGNATFVVFNPRTKASKRYKFEATGSPGYYKITAPVGKRPIYLGMAGPNGFLLTAKAQESMEHDKLQPIMLPLVKGITYVLNVIQGRKPDTYGQNFEIRHQGKCGKCGKARLKSADSVASGIGPECANI